MVSIFIIYSNDRRVALDATISCLEDMKEYQHAQKLLIVDGHMQGFVKGFEIHEVPRVQNQFCWGKMWSKGVEVSKFSNIIYLDADRLLPNNFLEKTLSVIKDHSFVFTSLHFPMLQIWSIEKSKQFLRLICDKRILTSPDFIGQVAFETRSIEPLVGPGKGVMSGSTAFTKETYRRLGGVDQWYCGHGAYADTDFHRTASLAGCQFIDLKLPELHFPHVKLDSRQTPLTTKQLHLLAAKNLKYYKEKWNL